MGEKIISWEEALIKNIIKEENNYRDKDNNKLVILPNGVKRYREPGRGLYNKLQHGAVNLIISFVNKFNLNESNINNMYSGIDKYYSANTISEQIETIVELTILIINDKVIGDNIIDKIYKAIDMVAKRCEEGARKYDDADNWRKGIPCDWLIDSSLRHYNNLMLKLTDDEHLSALLWNLFTLIEILKIYGNKWVSNRYIPFN